MQFLRLEDTQKLVPRRFFPIPLSFSHSEQAKLVAYWSHREQCFLLVDVTVQNYLQACLCAARTGLSIATTLQLTCLIFLYKVLAFSALPTFRSLFLLIIHTLSNDC